MKNNSSYSDFLKHENELTKLKIKAELGLDMNSSSNGDLNPAIENIFLNQVLEFERAAKNSKQITIREFLGNPEVKPVNEIKDSEMQQALQSLMEILHKKNVMLDTLCEVPEREIYRFITEELFLSETNSEVPKNMMTCFIYEEFHPNHEYDVKNRTTEFVESLAKKDSDFYEHMFCSIKENEELEVKISNLKRKISYFKDAFDEIRVEEINIESVSILDDRAETQFSFKLWLVPAESRDSFMLSKTGKINLVCEYDWWSICDVTMEGVI